MSEFPEMRRASVPVALTIAGSDPSGGAGIQADLKTFHQHGVYGMSVITLLTVQNTQTVSHVEIMSSSLLVNQLAACLDDIPPHAAKTGALGSRENIEAVAEQAKTFRFPLVVDPVMISKHHVPLMNPDAVDALIRYLLPVCHLVTPNLPEASQMVGFKIDCHDRMEDAAKAIAQQGAKNVFLKGGHLEGKAVDVLLADGELYSLVADRIDTPHTHGTGCTTSAAITARLARGESLLDAVEQSKQFITAAIESHPGLGHGRGPVNFFADVNQKPKTLN